MTEHTHAEDSHRPNVKRYLAVFAALMFLTVVTVLVSYWHLPPAMAIMLGLAIATFKAGLVAYYFMHLKGEHALICGLLAMTLAATAILFLGPTVDSSSTSWRRTPQPITEEDPAAGERSH